MCMYACTTHIYAYTHIQICACILYIQHASAHIQMGHIYIYICTYIQTFIHTHIYKHIFTYLYAYSHTHTCTHIHTYMHKHTHICPNMHTPIYTDGESGSVCNHSLYFLQNYKHKKTIINI